MREHERVQVTMPIRFKNRVGIAKNVSTTGIYFEMKSESGITSEISFDVEMNTPFGSMNLKCKGMVVRKEQKRDRIGIAIRLLESEFKSINHLVTV